MANLVNKNGYGKVKRVKVFFVHFFVFVYVFVCVRFVFFVGLSENVNSG